MPDFLKNLIPPWPVLAAAAALIALLAWQTWRIDGLQEDKASLQAAVSNYTADLDTLLKTRATEEAVQAAESSRAAARNKRKAEIHEAINAAPDDAPVSPVLRDTIERLSRPGAAAAGHKNKPACQPAELCP